jgi:phage terminase large subunit-like protein
MLMFGLRAGVHPRWLVTTTPKAIKLLKELLAREGKDVVVTRGSTFENAANLAAPFLEAIRKLYEGTRLGRQELNAELLSDTPGALWQLDWLDRNRVERAPELKRIIVAIDPAVSNNEGSDWDLDRAPQTTGSAMLIAVRHCIRPRTRGPKGPPIGRWDLINQPVGRSAWRVLCLALQSAGG